MKSNMCVKVDFLVGVDLREAIKEAKIKAIEWNVAYVKFEFNGVSCSISHKADIDVMEEAFHKALSGDKMKFIVG
ncbi:hypothetical protein D3C85_681070 [compost metagenome]